MADPRRPIGDPTPLTNKAFAGLGALQANLSAKERASRDAAVADAERTAAHAEWLAKRALARPAERSEAEARLSGGPGLDERFRASLRDNFSQYPTRPFETTLPGLKQYGVRESGDGSELLITLTYEEAKPVTKEFPGYVSLRLSRDGQLTGELPADLRDAGLTMDLVRDEIIRKAEVLRIGFWIQATVDEAAGIAGTRNLTGESSGNEVISREELERLEFLRSLENAAFGAMITSARGFNGYNAIMLRGGTAVLDNQVVGNAVYVIRGLPAIAAPSLSQEEKMAYFDANVRPVIQSGKQGARGVGAVRITHQADNWRETILAAI